MASDKDFSFVIDNIEPNYIESGWDSTEITARLDAGAIPQRVVAAYWARRAAQVIQLVNTSESGSSRGMDSVYPRFKALADQWDAKAMEVEVPPTSVETRGRLGSFPIRRV